MVGVAVSFSPFIFLSNIQPLILAVTFLIINLFSYKHNKLKSFHNLNRKTLGTIFFPLGFIIIAALFWEYKYNIACCFMILAIADPLSSLTGENIKKPHKYNVGGDVKSYEGSMIMFLSTFIILYLFSNSVFHQFDTLETFLAIMLSCFAITIAEAMSIKGSDNISIPLTAFFFIEIFNTVNMGNFIIGFSFVISLITIVLFYFYKRKHLSLDGFLSSTLMAGLILGFGGLKYVLPIAIFFILSTLLSKVGMKNLRESKSGRNASQVFANGGVGLVLCIFNHFYQMELIYIMFLASIAAANSDTWATEIGKLSRKRPKDIISGRSLNVGESGGITFIGLLGSMSGSFVIATVGYFLDINTSYLIILFISGFLGSIFDSILGSTLQSRFILIDGKTIKEEKEKDSYHYSGLVSINNNSVNFLCTLSAPIFFILLYLII
tara:strand:- start:417 stop:1727 length:1311 start_codon:yes stop_codon:yes gene_type:complete